MIITRLFFSMYKDLGFYEPQAFYRRNSLVRRKTFMETRKNNRALLVGWTRQSYLSYEAIFKRENQRTLILRGLWDFGDETVPRIRQ